MTTLARFEEVVSVTAIAGLEVEVSATALFKEVVRGVIRDLTATSMCCRSQKRCYMTSRRSLLLEEHLLAMV